MQLRIVAVRNLDSPSKLSEYVEVTLRGWFRERKRRAFRTGEMGRELFSTKDSIFWEGWQWADSGDPLSDEHASAIRAQRRASAFRKRLPLSDPLAVSEARSALEEGCTANP